MPLIEETLYTRLSNYAGLTSLVGTRIYPMILPQGVTYPAVEYSRVGTYPRESCMISDVGVVRARYRITAWATTFTSVKSIANQIRLAMQRYTTTGVQATFIIGEYDIYDDEAEKYGAAIDIELIYTE